MIQKLCIALSLLVFIPHTTKAQSFSIPGPDGTPLITGGSGEMVVVNTNYPGLIGMVEQGTLVNRNGVYQLTFAGVSMGQGTSFSNCVVKPVIYDFDDLWSLLELEFYISVDCVITNEDGTTTEHWADFEFL